MKKPKKIRKPRKPRNLINRFMTCWVSEISSLSYYATIDMSINTTVDIDHVKKLVAWLNQAIEYLEQENGK